MGKTAGINRVDYLPPINNDNLDETSHTNKEGWQ